MSKRAVNKEVILHTADEMDFLDGDEKHVYRGLKVHPAADFFPMMPDEELETLAVDIAENGQRFPIIVDKGVLIDGRNRLKACEIAGVKPEFEELGIRDPLALIFSANVARRNLKKGQLAMTTAMIYPVAKRGRGNKDIETTAFSKSRLDQARQVLRHSKALAREVMLGKETLDKALEKVQAEQRAAADEDAILALLRAEAPDLADLVDEERMSISEAHAAYRTRKQEREMDERTKRDTHLQMASQAYRGAVSYANETSMAELNALLLEDGEFRRRFLQYSLYNADDVPQIIEGATHLAVILSNLTSTMQKD